MDVAAKRVEIVIDTRPLWVILLGRTFRPLALLGYRAPLLAHHHPRASRRAVARGAESHGGVRGLSRALGHEPAAADGDQHSRHHPAAAERRHGRQGCLRALRQRGGVLHPRRLHPGGVPHEVRPERPHRARHAAPLRPYAAHAAADDLPPERLHVVLHVRARGRGDELPDHRRDRPRARLEAPPQQLRARALPLHGLGDDDRRRGDAARRRARSAGARHAARGDRAQLLVPRVGARQSADRRRHGRGRLRRDHVASFRST